MTLFNPDNRTRSHRSRRFYAATETLYTAVDFGAAMSFLIGSALFALKPAIRFVRELRLAAMGDEEDLAERE